MLSKSKFHLFLIMIINIKKNLLVNFFAITFRNRNSVSKNSEISFLQIETNIETEYIPFLAYFFMLNLSNLSKFNLSLTMEINNYTKILLLIFILTIKY